MALRGVKIKITQKMKQLNIKFNKNNWNISGRAISWLLIRKKTEKAYATLVGEKSYN